VQVKTKNMVVGGLIVLLVGLLWWRVVYSPMESKASKDKTAAHDSQTSAANLRTAIGAANGSTSKKKPTDVSSKAMLTAIPIDAAEASFLRSIDELRLGSGADWQSISPSTPVVANGMTSITVAITAQGSEDEIARYVAGLSAMPRVFIVDNMAITKSGSSAAAGSGPATGQAGAAFFGDQLSLSITGRIFSQQAVASTTTGAGGSSTTPTTGAPAPTGSGAPTGTVNG
jgi:Tfp pilus assembly protein PilO